MPIVYAGQLETTVMSNANLTTTGAGTANSGELDIINGQGTAILTINDRASGTAAATIAVTHSLTTGGTFTAVPAASLFNLSTGAAATFAALSTSASDQSLGLDLSVLRRFVRVEFTGTDIDHNLCVVATVGKREA
jgi:hypothetical protein